MGRYAKLKKETTQNIMSYTDSTITELDKIAKESRRVANVIHNANAVSYTHLDVYKRQTQAPSL